MCCLFLAASSTVAIAQTSVVDLVNPIIGTNGMGHTFPGACVPFGLVQLSPDTDTIPHNVDGKYQPRSYEYCAGYQHKDSSIELRKPILSANAPANVGSRYKQAEKIPAMLAA